MTMYSVKDKSPVCYGSGQFIADSADIIGDVHLKDSSSVWFQAVIRAENDRIEIGERTNIQDGAVLHVDPGYPLVIGNDVIVGHKAVVHGCTIGDGCLVGINAVILNGASIGNGCIIGANALVTENMQVPDGSLVLGSPGSIKKQLTDEQQQSLVKGAGNYVRNAKLYNETLEKL